MAPGYAGAALLIDREAVEACGVTSWATLADMNAAEQVGLQVRRQSSETTGAQVIDVNRFELVLVDRMGEPKVPSFSRVHQLYADPARLRATLQQVYVANPVHKPASSSLPALRPISRRPPPHLGPLHYPRAEGQRCRRQRQQVTIGALTPVSR